MRFAIILFLLFVSVTSFSQKAVIKGKITDKTTKEPLPGINILLEDKSGGTSDINGLYEITVNPGKHQISYLFIGYKNTIRNVEIREGETMTLDIKLEEEIQVINEVVVSAGRFEQKISEVTVSMEVIKPALLENNNTLQVDNAMNQVPGVEVMDDQPSIRGGSGYSYGAGSRVLMLVDDMPIMSADVGDIKWNFIPIENVSQIEIIKGASSALFGSSALNGVVNFRTAFPGPEPVTKLTIFNGMYMNPRRKELIWWGTSQPLFGGASFLHSRRIGNFDVVLGGNGFLDDGYREFETEERFRLNGNFRYRFKNIEGLSVGVNANAMTQDKTEFFLWQNADSGAWKQAPDGMVRNTGNRYSIDPYIIYHPKSGNRHSLRTRVFRTKNRVPGDDAKNSTAGMYFMEYQFQKNLEGNLNWTIGTTLTYGDVLSALFGDHTSFNYSAFSQFDKKLGKLNLSAGIRAEYFRIDKEQTVIVVNGDSIEKIPIIPVFRFGASYELAQYTFLRGSFGQGYRFPSVAEKYTLTNVSALKIFPNPELKSETGWSSEIGIKQGFKFSGWNGYIDVAGFWTEYKDMMEYTFGFYHPETYKVIDPTDSAGLAALATYGLECVGFQSINVGNAQITGIDFTITGIGKILGIPATLLAGYTYINPIDLNVEANDSNKSNKANILKYRFYHSAKADLELDIFGFMTGISMVYHSRMINIDKIFEEPLSGTTYLLPGLKEYREKHKSGEFVFDLRVAYQVNMYSKISLVLKNAFNREYMGRPGDIRPPRTLSLQYTLNM